MYFLKLKHSNGFNDEATKLYVFKNKKELLLFLKRKKAINDNDCRNEIKEEGFLGAFLSFFDINDYYIIKGNKVSNTELTV